MAVLVLFLVTMVIAVVLGVALLLLLCSKYNVSSRVGYGCLFIVYTMSSLLKRDVIYVSAYAALLYGYTQSIYSIDDVIQFCAKNDVL